MRDAPIGVPEGPCGRGGAARKGVGDGEGLVIAVLGVDDGHVGVEAAKDRQSLVGGGLVRVG
jgi:hypothetical protein